MSAGNFRKATPLYHPSDGSRRSGVLDDPAQMGGVVSAPVPGDNPRRANQSNHVDVRRLGPDDSQIGARAIQLLKAPDRYATPSIEYLARFLSRPGNVLIVALDDGEPVGYLVGYLLDRVDRDQQMMLLYEIGVAEPHRRRGIGTRMIGTLKAICRAEDVLKMWAPTGRSNVAATRLYASTGAAPLDSGDEVMYAYPRESFMGEARRSSDG